MKKTKINIVFALVLIISFLLTNTVYAAGSFSVSASGTMNLSATQSMSISTNGCAGKFSVKSSNASVVSVSSSSVFVDGTEKITLTAKSAGTATITVTAVDVLDPSYNEVTGSKSVTITVKGNDTNSENTGSNGSTGSGNTGNTGNSGNTGSSGGSNTGSTTPQNKPSSVATLKNLGIKPNDFSGFKPGKYNYSVTVENSVDKVTVYASTTHNKATWSVSGANVAGVSGKTVSLKEGTNNIYVTVTAEDGSKQKYTISVTRKSSEGEVIPNVIEDQEFEQVGITEAFGLKTLEVDGLVLDPEFNTEVYEYNIAVDNEEIITLEELKNKMKYEANFENALIEVQSENEEFSEGENLVYIIVKDSESEVAKYTLKINLKEQDLVAGIVTEEENTPLDDAPVIPKEKLILISAISLLGIISIVIMIRYYMVSQRLEIFENEIEFKDIENTNSIETAAEKLEKLSEINSADVEYGSEYRRPGGRRRGGKHRER